MSKRADNDLHGPGKYAPNGVATGAVHGPAILDDLEPGVLLNAIRAVLVVGDAILFGTTRDGGAVAMQLYSGEDIDKIYAATLPALEDALRGITFAAST